MVKKNYSSKKNLSVSLITITQNTRIDCIDILFDIIKNQTYKNIIEWVLVEGSKTKEDADYNSININNLIKKRENELNLKIKYIERTKSVKLGELRNIGNKNCIGDITVCMDDDDYYFPDRVEHAVNKLSNSDCKIAGCSTHLMYDYSLNILVQMKKFKQNHSINSAMAWKKEYLLDNSHDPDKEFAEEQSFTKNFTEQMIQLDPYSTVIVSSHNMNTFSKKTFFLGIINNLQNNAIEKIIKTPINKLMNNKILERYQDIFIVKDLEDYDIVYMCGAFSIRWDPEDQKLGGSEQAVVNLSENWVKLGKSVIVYGEVPNKIINSVVYKHWTDFDYTKKYKNIILWRIYGINNISYFNIEADNILIDVHDNFSSQFLELLKKYYNKCNKILLKSEYHKQCFLERINKNYNNDNLIIIPNGIRVEKFIICPDNIVRNPYRFCYCSCYTRGLDILLSIVWPIIYNYEPRSELHVYYGMDAIKDEQYKNKLKMLLSSPGVMDHGRQPIDLIIREKYMSNFHFYMTNTEQEIDCISIRESIVTGCIPLLSTSGVFKEREGFHFDFDNEKNIRMAAIRIIDLLKNPHKVEELRNNIKTSKTIINWKDVATEWLKYIR